MKRFSLLFLVAGFVLSGCNEAPAPLSPSPRTVLTTAVKGLSSSESHHFPGFLRAADRASLSFETGGLVTRLEVELGDQFRRGAMLAYLDDTHARLELNRRFAEKREAEAVLRDAKLEYTRLEKLRNSGAVSIASIDQSQARYDSARAKLSAVQAAIDTAREQLEDLRLIAPFDGEVVKRLVEPAQVIGAGQSVLDIVGRDGGLEGIVQVPDLIRQKLMTGDHAELRLLASGTVLKARISETGNRANSAGLFPVVLTLTGAPVNAKAGQAIEVTFGASRVSNDPVIPLTAYTVTADGQAYVFKITDGEDFVRRQPVKLGDLSSSGVQVLRGLSVGSTIVTKGVDLLSDGEVVVPVDVKNNRFGS